MAKIAQLSYIDLDLQGRGSDNAQRRLCRIEATVAAYLLFPFYRDLYPL
jgi:hypothetical protein